MNAAQPQSWQQIADELARMSRELLAKDTATGVLEGIVTHTLRLVDGCEHAGILLLHPDRRIETPAATSDLVHESDRLQGELGEGPCFDAVMHDQEVYRLDDLNERVTSWPRYGPEARQLGIASMLGFELYTAGRTYAALNVYATRPKAFTKDAEHVGRLLSAHAGVAVAATRAENERHPALKPASE